MCKMYRRFGGCAQPGEYAEADQPPVLLRERPDLHRQRQRKGNHLPDRTGPFFAAGGYLCGGVPGDQDTIRAIKQMQKNMENRQNGALAFTAVDGTKLILTYYQLDSYDWVLFTLIPADLISQQTDTYISQTFLIIAAIILLFFTILLLIFRINREHLRKMKQAAFIDRLTGAPTTRRFRYIAPSCCPSPRPTLTPSSCWT